MMKKPPNTASRRRVWSYKAGEKGRNRVRVFAWPEQGKSLWIDYRDGGRRIQKPLGHADKDRAKREADDVAGRWGQDTKVRPAALTLRTLFDIYEREVTPQKNSASARGHDRRILPLLLKAFGADRRPETLNVRDWQTYIRRWRSGELAPQVRRGKEGNIVLITVRARAIEQDLKLLLAVFNWAERARADGSGYLLERSPLRGLKLPKEESPRRPMFTPEQCVALRTAAAKHSPFAELAVMLAWFTGHRAGAIRQLRWSDIDHEAGTIRWRAETDKVGYEHRNPLHPELVSLLKRERARTGAIGEAWLFPSDTNPAHPCSRVSISSRSCGRSCVMRRGFQALKRYGWHSFRRAFANALRDVPLRELKDLGGWKSERTVVAVYLRPDEQAQRTALGKLASNGQ